MAARFIVLTVQSSVDPKKLTPVRFNVDHIQTYYQGKEGTTVNILNRDPRFVIQTVEQIDGLIAGL